MGKENSSSEFNLDIIFETLKNNYDLYAKKYNIKIDKNFLILKIMEELGELSRAVIASEGNHPKNSSSIDEEACDLLCQVIVFIKYNSLDIYPTLLNKWLINSKDHSNGSR